MFFKKKALSNNIDEKEPDVWGREPLALYEQVGRKIDRSEKNFRITREDHYIFDFMVLFYNGKPDIRGVGGLLYEAEWTNYGTKIYRVNTTLSAEALEALIIDELSLTNSDFLVSPTAIDPRIY
ncbi:MAG: hypothetical protein ACTJG1_10325 [Enterococcus gilvus]